jgi:hypothetical protein
MTLRDVLSRQLVVGELVALHDDDPPLPVR